jgi:hypothetical protein
MTILNVDQKDWVFHGTTRLDVRAKKEVKELSKPLEEIIDEQSTPEKDLPLSRRHDQVTLSSNQEISPVPLPGLDKDWISRFLTRYQHT